MPAEEVIARRSPLLINLFTWYARRYVARHFRAVRLAREGAEPVLAQSSLVVVVNHPSWWDPLIGMVLAGRFSGWTHFAPIETAALERYRFFRRLGFFGVDAETLRGRTAFLRTACDLLKRRRAALWIAAQGRFADPRERPADLRSGIGHLARRLGSSIILPLALEYPFWEERCPEALARFGEPIPVERGRERDAAAWTALVEGALVRAQEALARDAVRRNAGAFEVILEGRSGVGGLYDLWRALRARLRGEEFRREHGEELQRRSREEPR
jgi:1-acyl-sn-glycerol-3-phosphate acyltransferase